MKAIILATVAVLTAGTATAQTQTYDTGNAVMTTSKELCEMVFKGTSDRVLATANGTQIDSGGSRYLVTPDGNLTSLNSPFPDREKAALIIQMANSAQRACANGVKAMELEGAQ